MEDMCGVCVYNGGTACRLQVDIDNDPRDDNRDDAVVGKVQDQRNSSENEALLNSAQSIETHMTTVETSFSLIKHREIVHVPIQVNGGYQNEFIFCCR